MGETTNLNWWQPDFWTINSMDKKIIYNTNLHSLSINLTLHSTLHSTHLEFQLFNPATCAPGDFFHNQWNFPWWSLNSQLGIQGCRFGPESMYRGYIGDKSATLGLNAFLGGVDFFFLLCGWNMLTKTSSRYIFLIQKKQDICPQSQLIGHL